jgi:Uncharacterized conserved protein
MKHLGMHLNTEAFTRIAVGEKTIEYRLNDDKRSGLEIGDRITFFELPNDSARIEVVVTDLKRYPDLLSMYEVTFDRDFKDTYSTPQDVVNDTNYYSEEDVRKYGCVAIYFKRLSSNNLIDGPAHE